jgi:DNA-binding MarR family transcriptional regulator
MTKDGTRWLDDNEAAAWMPLMSTIMWLPAALDVQLRRDAGITHVEYGVLSSLSTATDRTMRLRELARIANSTLSRLSKVVDRLSDHGWVERRPDPEDGRSTLATLTEEGPGQRQRREAAPTAAPEVMPRTHDLPRDCGCGPGRDSVVGCSPRHK